MKNKIIVISLIVLCFIVSIIGIVVLDDVIPIHFGIDGKPDQYGSKYFLLAFPILNTVITTTMFIVAKYGKVTDNYRKYLVLTNIILSCIFISMCGFLILYNENTIDISKIMMLIFGITFIILGNVMPKIEINRTLGIKTKWSLYNETTWRKTHRFSGFASVIVGFIVVICGIIFSEKYNSIILFTLLLIFMILTVGASYIYYKKEVNNTNSNKD